MMETDRIAPLSVAVWERKSILNNHSSTGTAGIQIPEGLEGAAGMRPIPTQGQIPTGEEFRARADSALRSTEWEGGGSTQREKGALWVQGMEQRSVWPEYRESGGEGATT